ncbi:hypothetical protein BFW01_g5849 [Lasiodiplodia theobromae]|nr:hypothetical protein BFW01_g5849 [Lasiodiplodia theobromae]
MSNLGSLITTFTPGYPACTTSLWYRGYPSRGGDLVLGLPGTSSTWCLPPDFRYGATNYYSPGICPAGYSYGCTSTATRSGEETTIATCCPSGWACRNDPSAAYACVSVLTADTDLTIGSYEMSTPTGATASTTRLITGGTTVAHATKGLSAFAWGPIVRRASGDPTWPASTATAAASSSSSSTTSSDSTAAAAASTTTTAAESGSGSSTSLSTGAKAGIGVGAAVAGLLVIAACVLRRRRRRRQGDHTLPPMDSDSVGAGADVAAPPIAELPAEEPLERRPQELHGNALLEAPVDKEGERGVSGAKPAELAGA